jgi:choline dehydrogenase-like flavoprotein
MSSAAGGARHVPATDPEVADVVIVGSGPSGSVAANVLCDAGLDVVLLDAGVSPPSGVLVKAAGATLFRTVDRSMIDDDRHDGDGDVEWYSSRSIGGLSNYWTSSVPRFAPGDFTDGEPLGDEYRWPIGYEDVAPYYERVERLMGITAGAPIPGLPEPVAAHRARVGKAWQELARAGNAAGHAIGPMPMAVGSPWMAVRRAREFSSYHCVIAPLVEAGRLRLRTGAHVSAVRRAAPSGTVEAVEFYDRFRGERNEVRCRAVVLAAGAVDTALILLRSRDADFPDGIGNARGLVGRYLTDHPREWWQIRTERELRAPNHLIYVARPPHGSTPPLLSTSHAIGLARPRDRLLAAAHRNTDRFGVQVFGTMVPQHEHRVALTEPSDHPFDDRPELHIRYDRATTDNLVTSRERLRSVMADAGLAITLPGPFRELKPGTSVHYSGTARMHDDPRHGVVDGVGRVHDAPDVIVADTSVFTTSPEKSPTLASMAIAARSCDHLATALR